MTPLFVFAITANGKAGLVRHSRQQIEQPGRIGIAHLSSILAAERVPCLIVGGVQRLLHQLSTWSQVG